MNNNKPLMRSNVDFKDHQSYIYPTDMDAFNCILIQANLPLVVPCIKYRLIAYASKRMPEAAKNYSITELEMCGLAMNIATFSHLLKKVDFDAIVDHLAITHIMRSKAEPATTRIKRLLELLSPYSFNLYYIKGKDMVLSDFLSRQTSDDSNPHELIPILFSLKDQVSDYFYRIDNKNNLPRKDKYLVQTRSQVRSSGIRLPEIHGANKGLDPHAQPGKQKSFPIQTVNKRMPTHPIPKPRVGQGRAGLRRKVKAPLPIASPHPLPVQPIKEHDSKQQCHCLSLLTNHKVMYSLKSCPDNHLNIIR